MNLNQLHYFAAVGELGSVSKAALKLHVSQPTISDSIKALEQELGICLFHRIRQRMYLSEDGKYYLEKISKILSELDELNTDMVRLGSSKRVLKIGIPPMIGTFLFPQIFSGFSDYAENVLLEIKEGGSIELLHDLENENIDLAIVAACKDEKPKNSSFTYQKIAETELVYCVSRQHPLAGNDVVDVAALSGERLILFKEGYLQNKIIMEEFEEAGRKLPVIFRTNQLYTIITFIRQNLGTSFMFRDVVNMAGDIVPISLENKKMIDLHLVWKSGHAIYRDVRLFIHYLNKWVGQDASH